MYSKCMAGSDGLVLLLFALHYLVEEGIERERDFIFARIMILYITWIIIIVNSTLQSTVPVIKFVVAVSFYVSQQCITEAHIANLCYVCVCDVYTYASLFVCFLVFFKSTTQIGNLPRAN